MALQSYEAFVPDYQIHAEQWVVRKFLTAHWPLSTGIMYQKLSLGTSSKRTRSGGDGGQQEDFHQVRRVQIELAEF